MRCDFLIAGGHVIDPRQGMDGRLDVAIGDDRILAVGNNLREQGFEAGQTIDADGLLVIPGIIDMHSHVYWGATSLGVEPDALSKKSGTTTWLDVGSAGPGNFEGFREFVINRSQSRVRGLLHISFAGIYAFGRKVHVGESQDMRLLNPAVCAQSAVDNADLICGIKVRIGKNASGYNGLMPLKLALEAADIARMPLMCHIDEPPPTIAETLDQLRPGDVLTHAFRPRPNAPIDGEGRIRQAVLAARERGVLFDIGHGMGSFSFDVAEQMLNKDFMPDVISSDVHALCIDGPAFDNLETMNKFLTIGMPLADVVKAVTQTPAAFMREGDLGHLGQGAKADVTVLRQQTGDYVMHDVTGDSRSAPSRYVVENMFLDGQIWV